MFPSMIFLLMVLDVTSINCPSHMFDFLYLTIYSCICYLDILLGQRSHCIYCLEISKCNYLFVTKTSQSHP